MKSALPIVFIIFMFWGCDEKPPVAVDGNVSLEIHTLWDATPLDSTDALQTLNNAKVILLSEYGNQVCSTNDHGTYIFQNLPYAKYSVSVRMTHPDDPNIVVVGNIKDIDLTSNSYLCDTIVAKQFSSFGISINEIYSSGPVNNIFFFYDLFIELYNSSDSVRYLDGMTISRVSGNNDPGMGPGADEGNDGDIDGVTYMFKFPGNAGEKNYSIQPKQFIVLACDAINHKNTVSTSIDLSNADWEFYNQYSADDIDNPNVANLINVRSDRTVDFLIGLTGDVIVLQDGRDTTWSDGLDISGVIDGIEYQSSSTQKKTLDNRVDRGFALSPPRYSGQSMQRREPGSDSNDGTMDWEIIPAPTPGYFK